MIVTMPIAAIGVSMGLILNRDGSNRPIAPRNSDIPINLTSAAGISFTQGTVTESSGIVSVDFMIPAITKIPPKLFAQSTKQCLRFWDFVILLEA
jgi:hypothetical protein